MTLWPGRVCGTVGEQGKRGGGGGRKLRNEIASRPIKIKGDVLLNVTVSVGVATVDASTRSLEELLYNADKALYRAKKSGKDCVVSYRKGIIAD